MGKTDARVLDAIRDAASVVVTRTIDGTPTVLMGQRGKTAAFMPSKFVFPGGAVDDVDAQVPLAAPLPVPMATPLSNRCPRPPEAFIATATRELFEETGLVLGAPGAFNAPPPDGWHSYSETGLLPDPAPFTYFFRAITPPGRPRRFDARFFLIDAAHIQSDPDDFSQAEDELSHLQWIPLAHARSYDMPFITEVVLAELEARLKGTNPSGVPFFDNSDTQSRFTRI